MNLFEYIKSQLPQLPNIAIMKDMGASQELIDYVKKTPENTNLGIVESIGESKIATMDFVEVEEDYIANISGIYNKTEYTGQIEVCCDAETGDMWIEFNNLTPEIEEIQVLVNGLDIILIKYYIHTNAHVDLYHPFYPEG